MANNHTRGAPSTAAIAGHPIHPIVIPFPIAFLVGALFADLAFWATLDPFWAMASLWLVGAGLVMGVLAGISGLTDFVTIGRAREHVDGWIHALGNGTVLAIAFANLLLMMSSPATGVLPWGLTLSAITAAILVVTGWYGGELSYRHMIGVTGHGSERGA